MTTWRDDNPRIPDTAAWVMHPLRDEDQWWWQMSLPRDCTLDQVQARYWTLQRLRRNAHADDKARLQVAYEQAISEKLRLASRAAVIMMESETT